MKNRTIYIKETTDAALTGAGFQMAASPSMIADNILSGALGGVGSLSFHRVSIKRGTEYSFAAAVAVEYGDLTVLYVQSGAGWDVARIWPTPDYLNLYARGRGTIDLTAPDPAMAVPAAWEAH